MRQTENTFYACLHNVYLLQRSYTFARQVKFTLEFGSWEEIFISSSKCPPTCVLVYPPSIHQEKDQDHHSLCLTLENRQQPLRTSITLKYFRVNDRSTDENESSMADVSLLRAVIMPLKGIWFSLPVKRADDTKR